LILFGINRQDADELQDISLSAAAVPTDGELIFRGKNSSRTDIENFSISAVKLTIFVKILISAIFAFASVVMYLNQLEDRYGGDWVVAIAINGDQIKILQNNISRKLVGKLMKIHLMKTTNLTFSQKIMLNSVPRQALTPTKFQLKSSKNSNNSNFHNDFY
jgi:hypothetical protein